MDSIVDDVRTEFAPDENDKEKRRRGNRRSFQNDTVLAPIRPVTSILSVKTENNFFKKII